MEVDVHTRHCCLAHGCKYFDSQCTVTRKRRSLPQEGPCERCREEGFEEIPTDGRSMNDDDFELLRKIVNRARFGQGYRKLLPEMRKRFKTSPEFQKVVIESLGDGIDE